MRAILGCALAVLLVGGAALAQDKKDEKIDAKKLVGKWEPKDAKEGRTFVIEFTKDGKMVITGTRDGKESKLEGTYKLEGNKLTTTTKVGDMERSRTLTVSKLTDAEFVGSDEKGMESSFVRAKEKKEK